MARYRKSPIYRTGNKHKNLNKIIPLMPKDINNFHDVFGGSGVVVINAQAKNKFYNELDNNTYNMIDYIKTNKSVVQDYKTFKSEFFNGSDKDFFEKTKKLYNSNRNIAYLWYLSFMSFSNDLRFNKDGSVNQPFGKRCSEEKLFEVNNFKNIELSNEDWHDYLCKLEYELTENDFIFFDPPYLQSTETNKSTYDNEWTAEQENLLLSCCKDLNEKGIKFMITNTISNKGVENELLKKFVKENKMNTVVLNEKNNANGKENNDYLEVAIFNYEPEFMQTNLF